MATRNRAQPCTTKPTGTMRAKKASGRSQRTTAAQATAWRSAGARLCCGQPRRRRPAVSYETTPARDGCLDRPGGMRSRMRGVDRLRARRGSQKVSFDDVADHLVDFVERHPDAEPVVDAIASFLADVEGTPHDHDEA